MKKKIKWSEVFDDFCSRQPRLHKDAVWWGPYDYLTVLIYFADGSKGTYEYFSHRLTFLKDKWTHDN